jgi:adenine-specific DNA-methyltransferase
MLNSYGRKLYLIQNCLYGVDIQPIAIQISKLRFFISLVCDQRTNRNKRENHGIRPLPNLETKFVAANALFGLKMEKQFEMFASPKVKAFESELQRVRHDHFAATTRQRKLVLQARDRELREALAKELEQGTFGDSESSRKLAAWNPYDPQQSAEFFEPLWMFD